MSRYRGIVVSERSAEETFDYLAEFSNAAEWDPGVAGADVWTTDRSDSDLCSGST